MRVHICGARGSTPAPGAAFARHGGHTSCVALAHDDRPPALLLDAGTGIRNVTPLLAGRPFDGAVLLGHLHWDHVQGLPFFAGGDHPDATVDLYLPDQGDDAEALLARGFSPPHFAIGPGELLGRWRFHGLAEGLHRIGGFDVLAREIPHKGGRTFGYRVSDATATVAYLSDHHPALLGPGPAGFGPYHEAACALAFGADLLVHDAQYLPEDWPCRKHYGHSTVDYAVGLAEAAAVGRLLLFHHDTGRTDEQIDEMTAAARRVSSVPVDAAFEHQIIELGP